jgi:hypothetical protein
VPEYSFHTGEQFLATRGFDRLARGDYADAEPFLRRAVEVGGKRLSLLPNPIVLYSRVVLGEVLYLQGKYDEARVAVEAVVPLARGAAKQTETPPGLATIYAAVLLIGGSDRTEDPRAALVLARRGIERLGDVPRERRALPHVILAVAEWTAGDRGRAVELLREARGWRTHGPCWSGGWRKQSSSST